MANNFPKIDWRERGVKIIRSYQLDSNTPTITRGDRVGNQMEQWALSGSEVRHVGCWPGSNPVLVSNLAVIAVSGSVSADLVRNIIFDELLRFDRLAPIGVNQVHGHSVVNLIVQQVIAPAVKYAWMKRDRSNISGRACRFAVRRSRTVYFIKESEILV